MGNFCLEREEDETLTQDTAKQIGNFYTTELTCVTDGIPSQENVPLICRGTSAPVAISPCTSSLELVAGSSPRHFCLS